MESGCAFPYAFDGACPVRNRTVARPSGMHVCPASLCGGWTSAAVSGLAASPAMTGRARVITPQREISRFWYQDVIAKAELAGVSPGQPGLAPEDAGGVTVDLGEQVLDAVRWRK